MANLPQFTGKYTTPGEYERPKTILDQSGFIYAKTLSDLGQGFTKALQGILDKQNAEAAQAKKDVEENFKFQQNQTNQLMQQLGKAGVNNDSLYRLGFDLIDTNSKLSLAIKQADSQEERIKLMNEQAMVNKKLGEYQGMITTMQDANATYASDVIEDPTKVGQQGGIATVGTPYNKVYNLGMPALSGTTKNANAEFYLDDNMNFRIRMTSDQIKKQTENGYIDENASVFLNFDPMKVPTLDKEIGDLLKASGIVDKDGNIEENYVDIKNAKYVTNNQGTIRYMVEGSNISGAMSATQNAREAIIKSYLADPQQAQVVYQQIFGNDDQLEVGGGGKGSLFTPESEIKFRNAFDTYFEAMIPQTRVGRGSAIAKEKPSTTATSKTDTIVSDRAKNIVDSLLKNPASTIREKLGPAEEFSTEGTVITIQRASGPESFDMNRKEDIINLARELDKHQYGADAITDKVSTEIGNYIESRRSKRNQGTQLTASQLIEMYRNKSN